MEDTEYMEDLEDVERKAKDAAYLIKIEEVLKTIGTTYNDLINPDKWRYVGGTHNEHLKYFRLACPGKKLPFFTRSQCVCGHRIEQNCFMTDGKNIVVFGNCCIKRFVGKDKRRCEKCGVTHKNTSINRCNNCKPPKWYQSS
jgi:hypothetical protein